MADGPPSDSGFRWENPESPFVKANVEPGHPSLGDGPPIISEADCPCPCHTRPRGWSSYLSCCVHPAPADEPPIHSEWDTVDAHFDEDRVIEDGFGGAWVMCEDADCGLEVVRPGKVQCWCDLRGECG